MSVICTEIEFILPLGFRDGDGNLHRNGVMRLATAGDEILPLKDHRVQSNPAYLIIIVLSRVIVRLGSLEMVSTKVVEELFAADFFHLQQLYNKINQVDSDDAGLPGEAQGALGKPGLLQFPTSFTQR